MLRLASIADILSESRPIDPIPPRGSRLAGRRAIVTGGAGSICRAVAAAFAAEGAAVAILDRDEAGARAAAAAIGGHGFGCDVTSEASVDTAVAAAIEALGGCDALLNGAGLLEMKPFEKTTLADWRRMQDINLTGPFLVTKAALPALKAAGRAAIVNVASMNAFKPAPWSAAYSAAKAGLVMLTKVLAAELGPAIRVNAICPGTVRSGMSAPHLASPEIAARADAAAALRRIGEPGDIAPAAVHLMSDESGFTTGTWLTIDGGNSWF